MQDCRIRWGTVDSVHDEHAVIVSRPLTFDCRCMLRLGEPARERVRWCRDGASLAPAPVSGQTVVGALGLDVRRTDRARRQPIWQPPRTRRSTLVNAARPRA